jgi:C-terminal processing protease CtpA/Prc
MITVDTDGEEDTGIDLTEYRKGEIYISDVRKGPFYSIEIDRGDKILSINGKKAKEITGVAHAEELMGSKEKITMFIMRPNPDTDRGHRWLMSQDE